MRLLEAVAICALVTLSVPSAHAQTDQQSPASNPTLENVEEHHPDWFKEPNRYKPCPASVVFANGQHACLGMAVYATAGNSTRGRILRPRSTRPRPAPIRWMCRWRCRADVGQ